MQSEPIIRASNYDRTDDWMGYDFSFVCVTSKGVKKKYATDFHKEKICASVAKIK
jgi:hypothetical protein